MMMYRKATTGDWVRRYINTKDKVAKSACLCQIRICISNKADEAFEKDALERLKNRNH